MAAKDKDDDDGDQSDASFEELARKADEAERATKVARADADEETAGDDESDEDARDASTKGVAKALGVDEDESAAGGDEEEAEDEAAKEKAAVQNRAARRREDAIKRRASRDPKAAAAATKRKAAASDEPGEGEEKADDDDDDAVAPARDTLPKDRNARAKELLKRRQDSVEGKRSSAIGLSAGEVVQDQVARAAAGTGKWLKSNFRYVVAGIVGTIAIAGGVIYYLEYQQRELGLASDTLVTAVESEYGHVFNDDNKDPRPPEQKQFDPTPVFATYAARSEAAIVGYDKVIAAYPGSGTAILATLSKAGTLLDMGKYDDALTAYDVVAKTELAKADVDVRARSIEGKAYALEGKKDNDAAMAAFRELENVDKAYEDLARYHQARLHLKKGEKDKAKELLVPLSKKLELPTLDGPQNRHLRLLVDGVMRAIDPTAVKKNRQFGGANRTPSEAEIQEIIRRQMQNQKANEHGDEGDHGDEGEMPIPFDLPEENHDDGSR